jgi:hypothetical protein
MAQASTPVSSRERSAFRADAAFEVLCGSVLMANPLVGPDLRINGFIVGLVGILLMVAAVFLGAAGLGKGLLARKLSMVCAVNALGGTGLLAWAFAGSMSNSANLLLVMIAAGSIALAAFQVTVLRQPNTAMQRVAPTQAELHAALRGEHPGQPRS